MRALTVKEVLKQKKRTFAFKGNGRMPLVSLSVQAYGSSGATAATARAAS